MEEINRQIAFFNDVSLGLFIAAGIFILLAVFLAIRFRLIAMIRHMVVSSRSMKNVKVPKKTKKKNSGKAADPQSDGMLLSRNDEQREDKTIKKPDGSEPTEVIADGYDPEYDAYAATEVLAAGDTEEFFMTEDLRLTGGEGIRHAEG